MSTELEVMVPCKNYKKQKIPDFLVHDSIPDCPDGSDENTEEISSENRNCKDATMIPCFFGDTRCFALHQLCLYENHDVLGPGYLKACRNGAHLADCSAADCAHHYKCQNYYCPSKPNG